LLAAPLLLLGGTGATKEHRQPGAEIEESSSEFGRGIAIGIMLGTAFGISTNNLAVGLAFGLMVGAALEALLQRPVDGTPLPPQTGQPGAVYNRLEKLMRIVQQTSPAASGAQPYRNAHCRLSRRYDETA
jgi:hypothetical protein